MRDKSSRKASVWNSSEKFMSVKIHVFKIASVAKLCSGIRRYFVKQQEICLFFLTAESRIFQSNYYESLLRSLSENQIFL